MWYNLSMFSKVIDISLPIKEGMAVYPGNPEVRISSASDILCGDSSSVSLLTLGSHTGTHVDAPIHAIKGAPTLSSFNLLSFIGSCKVFDATGEEEVVSLDFVKSKDIKAGDRVLFKTKNSLLPFEEFRNDYIFLSGDASEYLAGLDIALVGIDYLSIKQRGSKDNRPHTAFLLKGIPIIEGLRLGEVSEGEYVLSALPLSLNIDGAPLRAVLLEGGDSVNIVK